MNRHQFSNIFAKELRNAGFKSCTIVTAYRIIRVYQKAIIRALKEYGGLNFCNWGKYYFKTVPGGELVNQYTGDIWEFDDTETPVFTFSRSFVRRFYEYDDMDDILGKPMYIKGQEWE